MIVFISIISLIYFTGSYYVYFRGMQALPMGGLRTAFPWIFAAFTLSFMVGMFLERGEPTLVATVVSRIGSVWLAVLWYLFLSILLIDIVRLLNHFIPFIPQSWLVVLTGKNLFIGVVSFVGIVVLAGHLNALFPRVHKMDVNLDKPAKGQSEIKVALVTDVHMGFMIGNKRVKRLVKQLNQEAPDLILFGGDLVDHNPLPVIQQDMGRHFAELNPPMGVYAATGNHEYIGKPDVSIDYLSQFGIQYVRDTMINVQDKLWIVGREDRDKRRYATEKRKPLKHLLNGHTYNEPVILIDHQPVEYDAVAQTPVDLMVSGHTHKGQLWPFGYITRKVFENDQGLMQKAATWFYTSPGYGTWGPPVRTGNRPEIALITLKLK